MTQKEEARQIARLLNAWADGKTLQQPTDSGGWSDYTDIFVPCIFSAPDWRIKPEPRRMWTSLNWTTYDEDRAKTWEKHGHKVAEWREVQE